MFLHALYVTHHASGTAQYTPILSPWLGQNTCSEWIVDEDVCSERKSLQSTEMQFQHPLTNDDDDLSERKIL